MAAPVAPPPAPPAPSPTPQPVSQTDSSNKAIDDLFGSPEPTPSPAPKRTSEPPKKDATTPPKSEPKVDPPKADDTTPPKPGDPPKPQKASDLRSALDQSKAEAKQLREKLQEMEEKAKNPAPDPEKETWKKERETWTKKQEEYESEIRYQNYQKSQEFKEKYQVPFEKGYKDGSELVQTFEFKDSDKKDADGSLIEAGQARMATSDDWDNFLKLDNVAANKWAHEHFGYNAQEMIAARRDLMKLVKSKNEAMDEWRVKGADREKAMREQTENSTKEFQKLFEWERNYVTTDEKLKEFFTPPEGDEKGKSIMERGRTIAERAFGDTSKLTQAEKAKLYGAVFNKAAAFDYVRHLYNQSKAKMTELQTKLDEYEKSEPGAGDGTGTQTTETNGKMGDSLSAIDRKIESMGVVG